MKAVMLDVPADLLEDRRRKGLDRHDEMWGGVLHMVPQPTDRHQEFGSELLLVLGPIAKSRGLRATYETGLYRPGTEKDYRVPDILVNRPEHRSSGRSEGADLVIEILSPDDESRDKLPFYAELGLTEAFLLEPSTREIELYRLQDGEMLRMLAADGVFPTDVLGITLERIDGPRLLIRWTGGEVAI